jgi:hypothetical protein
MSFCTRAKCPHDRGVFVWLGDGPWLGDPSDPDHGNFPWTHDTTMTSGHLEVCELMPFATPGEAGELCACGCPSHEHLWNPGPVGHEYKPAPCPCGCPDFRHRPEGLERWRAAERGRRVSGMPPVVPAPAAPAPAETGSSGGGQLELFPVAAGSRPRRAVSANTRTRLARTVPLVGDAL